MRSLTLAAPFVKAKGRVERPYCAALASVLVWRKLLRAQARFPHNVFQNVKRFYFTPFLLSATAVWLILPAKPREIKERPQTEASLEHFPSRWDMRRWDYGEQTVHSDRHLLSGVRHNFRERTQCQEAVQVSHRCLEMLLNFIYLTFKTLGIRPICAQPQHW